MENTLHCSFCNKPINDSNPGDTERSNQDLDGSTDLERAPHVCDQCKTKGRDANIRLASTNLYQVMEDKQDRPSTSPINKSSHSIMGSGIMKNAKRQGYQRPAS
jgi:hypothetical protein